MPFLLVAIDFNDVIIDPCAGSGSSLVAGLELNRKVYGFEIKKDFFKSATNFIQERKIRKDEIDKFGFAKTELNKKHPTFNF